MEHNMTDTSFIKTFIYGGRAYFTLKSLSSGKHWSYRIYAAKDSATKFFVSVLTAPDRYSYIGLISRDKYYPKLKGDSSTAITALLAFISNNSLHPKLQFYHEGRCARCARPLTDPTSIERGMGAYCAGLS